jgi:hypothetical protein
MPFWIYRGWRTCENSGNLNASVEARMLNGSELAADKIILSRKAYVT